ncbi:unnamed protein product [Psylliodes chrysocephalus]|uniref:Coiled-coil domain-containing protein n=1 Tax=Psylliodes chrysocephalus TaxID=3402493 RepID=A0A9P0D2Q9_9CUCU|nr:unnamed protein product [Psylliodes chrysocephala]
MNRTDPSQPSLKQRIEKIVNIDPKEKQERLRQWMINKEEEVKQKFRERQAYLKRRRMEKNEEEILKMDALEKWRERKREEEEIAMQEERVREAELEKENETLMRIQEGSRNMYRKWLMLKHAADLQRKEEQKVRHEEFLLEQQKRREMGNKAFKIWLKESKSRATPRESLAGPSTSKAVVRK